MIVSLVHSLGNNIWNWLVSNWKFHQVVNEKQVALLESWIEKSRSIYVFIYYITKMIGTCLCQEQNYYIIPQCPTTARRHHLNFTEKVIQNRRLFSYIHSQKLTKIGESRVFLPISWQPYGNNRLLKHCYSDEEKRAQQPYDIIALPTTTIQTKLNGA